MNKRNLVLLPAAAIAVLMPMSRPVLSAAPTVTRVHAGAGSPSNTRSIGTVALVGPRGSNQFVAVHTSDHRMVTLIITSSTRLTTQDGRTLDPTAIRLGDRIAAGPGGRIMDASQRTVHLTGIVSFPPEPAGNSMVVEVRQSQDIMLTFGAGTTYSDASHTTTAIVGVQESDIVRMSGIFDSTLGEMTRTDSIARLGPNLRKGSASAIH